jgi:nitroreductase
MSETLRERRSIRRYQATPVDPELVREILREARWAPSSTNTQSTAVYVLTGDALARLKQALRREVEREARDGGPPPPALPEPYKGRMQSLFKTRADFLAQQAPPGSGAASHGEVPAAAAAMADLFGAPTLLVFVADKRLPVAYSSFDAGLFVQSVALAAHAHGLGTCIMTSPLRFASALREVLPLSEEQDLVAVLPLGHADEEAAINRFPRERVPLEEFVTFVS